MNPPSLGGPTRAVRHARLVHISFSSHSILTMQQNSSTLNSYVIKSPQNHPFFCVRRFMVRQLMSLAASLRVVTGSDLGDAGAVTLARGLRANVSLVYIDLHGMSLRFHSLISIFSWFVVFRFCVWFLVQTIERIAQHSIFFCENCIYLPWMTKSYFRIFSYQSIFSISKRSGAINSI